MVDASSLTSLIGNWGFPIVITCWFMYRMEKVLELITTSVNTNTSAINSLRDAFNSKFGNS